MNTEAAASAWRERAASLLLTLPRMAGSFAAPQRGPGTELKKLLKRIGITSSPTCSCNRRAAEMDARGIQWCEQNIEMIVGWLREEAGKRGMPFVDMAGTALVKLAIRRAKKKNEKLKSES